MFNVGEGTQRLCMEHGIRLAKTDHLFVTSLTSDTLGGVPGELGGRRLGGRQASCARCCSRLPGLNLNLMPRLEEVSEILLTLKIISLSAGGWERRPQGEESSV